MIMRKCPDCGTEWVSADEQGAWRCDKCKKMLTSELNEAA